MRLEHRVIICGSRKGFEPEPIRLLLGTLKESFGDNLVVIHGAANGVDKQAALEADRLGIETRGFPAAWAVHDDEWCPGAWCRERRYCVGAGPRRNHIMLGQHPVLVAAFKHDFGKGKGGGTENMIAIANDAGIRTVVVSDVHA